MAKFNVKDYWVKLNPTVAGLCLGGLVFFLCYLGIHEFFTHPLQAQLLKYGLFLGLASGVGLGLISLFNGRGPLKKHKGLGFTISSFFLGVAIGYVLSGVFFPVPSFLLLALIVIHFAMW